MNELTIILITALWFVMGIGVYNIWKRIIDDKGMLLIIGAWPLVLLITAIDPIKKDT